MLKQCSGKLSNNPTPFELNQLLLSELPFGLKNYVELFKPHCWHAFFGLGSSMSGVRSAWHLRHFSLWNIRKTDGLAGWEFVTYNGIQIWTVVRPIINAQNLFVFSESSILQLEDPDCEEGSNPPCESVFSLNAEKILVRSHTHLSDVKQQRSVTVSFRKKNSGF